MSDLGLFLLLVQLLPLPPPPPRPPPALIVSLSAIGFPVQSIVTSRGQKIQSEVSFNLMGYCFGVQNTLTHRLTHTHRHGGFLHDH